MAVHPKCPCTRASVDELARLISRYRDHLECVAFVYRPAGEADSWSETGTVEYLRELGAEVVVDVDGRESSSRGMLTSGSVVVYSPSGEPLYWGGITSARGHSGDNLGADAVAAILAGRRPNYDSQPVFGCRIHGNLGVQKE